MHILSIIVTALGESCDTTRTSDRRRESRSGRPRCVRRGDSGSVLGARARSCSFSVSRSRCCSAPCCCTLTTTPTAPSRTQPRCVLSLLLSAAAAAATGRRADEPSFDTQWTTYVRDEGAINATSWWGGTFHSCSASSETSLAAGCASLPLPFPVRAHADKGSHSTQATRPSPSPAPRSGSWETGASSPLSLASRSSLSRSAPAHLDHLDRRNPRQSRFYCALLDEDQPWRWYSGSTLASPVGGKEGLNSTRCALSGLEDKQHTLVFGQRQEDVLGNGVTVRRLFLGPLPSPLSSRESVLQDLLRQALQLLTPALSSSTTTSSTMRPTPPSRS